MQVGLFKQNISSERREKVLDYLFSVSRKVQKAEQLNMYMMLHANFLSSFVKSSQRNTKNFVKAFHFERTNFCEIAHIIPSLFLRETIDSSNKDPILQICKTFFVNWQCHEKSFSNNNKRTGWPLKFCVN